MKASLTADFLLFVGGLVILVIIMATAFGKGIIANFMSYIAVISPQFLSEDLATFLTVSAYMPGDVTASISVQQPRRFDLFALPYPKIGVTDISKFGNSMLLTPFTIDDRDIHIDTSVVDANAKNTATLTKIGNKLTISGAE